MYLIVTRSFPPEVGGMQNLMWGLSNAISKYFMIKVFADFHEEYEKYDKEVSFSIERVGGIKLLRKYLANVLSFKSLQRPATRPFLPKYLICNNSKSLESLGKGSESVRNKFRTDSIDSFMFINYLRP